MNTNHTNSNPNSQRNRKSWSTVIISVAILSFGIFYFYSCEDKLEEISPTNPTGSINNGSGETHPNLDVISSLKLGKFPIEQVDEVAESISNQIFTTQNDNSDLITKIDIIIDGPQRSFDITIPRDNSSKNKEEMNRAIEPCSKEVIHPQNNEELKSAIITNINNKDKSKTEQLSIKIDYSDDLLTVEFDSFNCN